ncbi:hypothetical protein SESBI_06724 [Sesbania bispinosa]|nr:hypothetical protein SESBI_06724 [Sesbania bispinosa]
MMDISFSNQFGYMSPSSCNQDMFYYSAPTSPSRLKLRAQTGFQTGPTTPRAYEDANSNLYEFEFETSHRFNPSDIGIETNQKDVNPFDDHQQEKQQQQRLCGDSLPTMAFADELFCDGKVLPMIPPLKLPPRLLQNRDGNMMSNQSSRVTSPRSPGSMLRLPFTRLGLWNDDFDPFMVALEKVREEKRGKPKAKHGLRRTRSLSPFRGFNKSDKHVRPSESYQPESHCCDTVKLISEVEKEPLNEAAGRTKVLSEPKGLVFARQVRQGAVVNETNFEAKKTSISKLAVETKKGESQRGGFWIWNKKRENKKKFPLGNANMGKASAQLKLEDQKAALGKPALQRKLDMKSVTSTQLTSRDKDETKGELTTMKLISYRPLPRLFLCLGFEGRRVK